MVEFILARLQVIGWTSLKLSSFTVLIEYFGHIFQKSYSLDQLSISACEYAFTSNATNFTKSLPKIPRALFLTSAKTGFAPFPMSRVFLLSRTKWIYFQYKYVIQYKYVMFPFSPVPCWWKALGFCAEDFSIKADSLHELRW